MPIFRALSLAVLFSANIACAAQTDWHPAELEPGVSVAPIASERILLYAAAEDSSTRRALELQAKGQLDRAGYVATAGHESQTPVFDVHDPAAFAYARSLGVSTVLQFRLGDVRREAVYRPFPSYAYPYPSPDPFAAGEDAPVSEIRVVEVALYDVESGHGLWSGEVLVPDVADERRAIDEAFWLLGAELREAKRGSDREPYVKAPTPHLYNPFPWESAG